MSSLCSYNSSEDDTSEDLDLLHTTDQLSTGSLELEDIQEAITSVKRTILETDVSSQARKDLVHKLIRLRIKKDDLENRKHLQLAGEQECLGHSMVPCDSVSASHGVMYCQECGGTLWYLIQTVFTCTLCSHMVHTQCVDKIRRRCVGSFLSSSLTDEECPRWFDGSVMTRICPEQSLAEQQYQCEECGAVLRSWSDARLCDYTGAYYCHHCHWGAAHPSPARIIHNWDFTPVPMSQAALQYINLIIKKPLIDLLTINPSLSAVIQEVSSVIKLRQRIMSMKKYLMVCRIAGEERILTQLQERQHCVDNSHMFTLQDLMDVQTGVMISYLETKCQVFKSHIITCMLCLAKSFVCEICTGPDQECLFPFDDGVDVCRECEAVYHRDCFRSVVTCPRCDRKRDKKESVIAAANAVFTVDID